LPVATTAVEKSDQCGGGGTPSDQKRGKSEAERCGEEHACAPKKVLEEAMKSEAKRIHALNLQNKPIDILKKGAAKAISSRNGSKGYGFDNKRLVERLRENTTNERARSRKQVHARNDVTEGRSIWVRTVDVYRRGFA